MMTVEYCPRNKVQKIEQELWNLTMKGDDISGYTDRFHELAAMCPTMVTFEYKIIECYIWELQENIQGNVTSSKPATTHDAIHMAHNLMDQKVRAKAARGSDGNKRKWEDYEGGNDNNHNNNHHHHQNQRQEATWAYAVVPMKGKGYAGNLPVCNRCKLHHIGPCTVKCRNYQKIGH
ncbi:hypothetical protein Tco_0369596 [Tanacetum coccineum]